MNQVVLMGRLTKDPEVRYAQNDQQTAIARYTLAVDRRKSQDGKQEADFIQCIAFGKNGEFAEKYLKKGTKIAITGRIQTGSYTNNNGDKVYTTDVVVASQEFAESKNTGNTAARNAQDDAMAAQYTANASTAERASAGAQRRQQEQTQMQIDGFMSIPDGIDEELPFH